LAEPLSPKINTAFGTSQQFVGFLSNLSTKHLLINTSFRQHVLHGLMVNLIDFAHAQHVDPCGLE
jgi:hypothetical protein